MTRQNYPKSKLHAAQKTSRNFIPLLLEIILTKALEIVLETGSPWHNKDVQFDKHVFFCSQRKQQMHVARLVCLTVVQNSNCKLQMTFVILSTTCHPSGCPSICQGVYFNSSWNNNKKWENINTTTYFIDYTESLFCETLKV